MEIKKLKKKIQDSLIFYLDVIDISNEQLARNLKINLRLIKAWKEKTRTIRGYEWNIFKTVFSIENEELDKLINEFETILRNHFTQNYEEYLKIIHFLYNLKYKKITMIDRDEMISYTLKELWNRYDEYIDINLSKATFVDKMLSKGIGTCFIKSRQDKKGLYSKDYSLDYLIIDNKGNTTFLWEILEDDKNLEKYIDDKLTGEYFLDLLERTVEKRRKYVIKKTIGEGFTLQEIGDKMGITRERVRQLQESGLRKIKNVFKKELRKTQKVIDKIILKEVIDEL